MTTQNFNIIIVVNATLKYDGDRLQPQGHVDFFLTLNYQPLPKGVFWTPLPEKFETWGIKSENHVKYFTKNVAIQ